MTALGGDDTSLDGSSTRPAGPATGRGRVLVYGNPAFRRMFGNASVGLPARETMLELPAEAFALMDAVFADGRPLARWIRRGGHDWRLTAIPRRELGSDQVYGIAFHLRRREDVPVVRPD